MNTSTDKRSFSVGDMVQISSAGTLPRGRTGKLVKIEYQDGKPVFAQIEIKRLTGKYKTELTSIRCFPGELEITKT